jgi:hypothetical protein
MPQCLAVEPGVPVVVDGPRQQVREVFIVHVGGTRCVTSSTGKNRKIRARITWTVEFIRTCIFIFVFYVWIQGRVWSRLTFFRCYWFSQLQWPRGLRRHRRPLPLRQRLAPGFAQRLQLVDVPRRLQVSEVFMIHVGGTRGVPSRTGNIMNIHARITLTVEFIRTCIFLFW